MMRRVRLGCLGIIGVVTLMFVIVHFVRRPSNARNWTLDQRVTAHAELSGPLVTVHDIRMCTYRTTTDYTCAYYDKTFDLRRLDSVWYAVEPFGASDALAHTFLSFGFGGDDFLAISAEIRKEQGESFSPWLGLVRQYEIMYVVGDERDIVKLRTNFRRDPVYLYPVRTTPERMRQLFVDMINRVNVLHEHPEFYNTLTNTCTSNIVRHANTVVPGRVPLSLATVFPGYSDRLAYRIGLIDTQLPFEAAKARYHINARALKYADDPQFSKRIRD